MKKILFVSLLFCSTFGFSQPILRIHHDALELVPDYVTLGQVMNIQVEINNIGNSTFADTLYVNDSINNVLYTDTNSTSGVWYDPTYVVIPPGGSIHKVIRISFTQGRFQTGSSVVVIWPKANSATSIGTARKELVVTDPLGIADVNARRPKPVMRGRNLCFNQPNEMDIRALVIYNMEGKIVLTRKNNSTQDLSLEALPPGIYIVGMEFSDGDQDHFSIDLH